MERHLPDDHRRKEPKSALGALWMSMGAAALLVVLVPGCSCGALVFWSMLGSPWPIEISDFFE